MEYDVCSAVSLAGGDMRRLEVAGQKILLVHIDDRFHALGADCPHAGGPLDEGVLFNGSVVCPWHKASFSLASGACTAPPAVDALPRYSTRVVAGRVLVEISESQTASPISANGDKRIFLIVGRGAAGTSAAQTLRQEGFSGRILLIGLEDDLPYDRTVLSKYALSGEQGGEKSPLHQQDFYHRFQIELVTARVTSLEATSHKVRFESGDELRYDAALIATGGRPKLLEIRGHELHGVCSLRTKSDAEEIVALAEHARRAVIIGGGFIGLEAAASLRERGLDVTVVAPESPLQNVLGSEVAQAIQRLHEQKGVRFRIGDEVVAFEGTNQHLQHVRLKGDELLSADLVVVGLGIRPITEFLEGLPLREDGSIDVDGHLRVTEGLFAAGDIAAFPLYGDGDRVRVEHWRVAQQHGHTAALNMLGQDILYSEIPVFWTIHFLQRLDYLGHAEDWDEIVIDGDLEKPEFLAFYAKRGQVQALAGWGRDKQMALATGLMGDHHAMTVEELRTMIAVSA